MIVRRAARSLHLITQPDHAQLARRIMERCVPLMAHPRCQTILHAIAEHDNGWQEADEAPTVDAGGRVADFVSAPLHVRQGVWPRAVDRLARDAWAAAIVAQHAITVYDRFRTDGAWRVFFHEMTDARDTMVRASGLTHDDLAADYPFLRLGDLISLAFCTAAEGRQQFGGWTVELAGSCVVVGQDVFGGERIPFEIVASAVPDRPFRSDADLRDALRTAAAVRLSGEVAGPPHC